MTDETDQPRFGPAEVIQIASKLTVDDAAFVIGGQATNLWAWYYQDKDPALRRDQPLTSRDIDYFGSFKAAENLAAALGGKAIKPTLDDMNTPNSAVVLATINGKPLKIDFLNGVLGVTRRELEQGVAVIEASAEVEGKERRAQIAVLHPVLCLKSRIANMLRSQLSVSTSPMRWKLETGRRRRTACRTYSTMFGRTHSVGPPNTNWASMFWVFSSGSKMTGGLTNAIANRVSPT
jgi:hypothetical protein